MKSLVIALSLFSSVAFAETKESCGQVKDVIFSTANAANNRLQITLSEKKTRQRVRLALSDELANQPSTIPLLLKSLENKKMTLCVTDFAEGKNHQGIGLLAE